MKGSKNSISGINYNNLPIDQIGFKNFYNIILNDPTQIIIPPRSFSKDRHHRLSHHTSFINPIEFEKKIKGNNNAENKETKNMIDNSIAESNVKKESIDKLNDDLGGIIRVLNMKNR